MEFEVLSGASAALAPLGCATARKALGDYWYKSKFGNLNLILNTVNFNF